ncbi:MAG: TetR family transcriptional regulator C-terminal domain-containing protein, partial [Caldilineaceae bacterium]|nr:TetR family transcriptional regulator C-terminal domain-containing protein [Caldilineaceae bacterium]
IFGRNGSPVLLARYHDYLAQVIATGVDGLYRMPSNVPPEIVAQFTAAAAVRLKLWWLEEQPEYTAAEMAAMLFELLYGETAPELPELTQPR